MKRAVFVAAAAVCAACGGTAASPSNAGSGSTPSVSTPAATSAKLKVHVSGAGRVVSAPAGLDCRDDCGATFASSAMVVLTAMADAGHAFSRFGGACSGMVCVLTLSGDTQVSATFTSNPAPPRVFTVTVDVSGSGIGRVESSPAGLDCKTGKCTASFVEGTKLSLGALPDPLSKTAFAGDCQGSACELTVARDLAVHVAFDQLHYQAIDLGVVDGGWWSTGGFITRQSGIVVGTWGGSNPRAFFWDGAMSDFNFGFASVSIAGYADGGLVAGNYAVTMPGTSRPFRLKDGVLRDLDLLPGGSNGMATRMNSRGTVVGYVNIGYGAGCRAVMWHGTAPMDLGVLEIGAALASAWGVNESDVAVGLASAPHVAGYEAVIFRGNGVIQELGTLGGLRGQANAINNHELVVGVADVQPQSNVMHGFFAVDGKLIDIGTPPGTTNSYLGAVNDVGVAVGGVGPDPRVGWRGIVATRERLVELSGLVDNTSATIGMASDIDEGGNIVATAANRAVLLVPQR